MRILNAAIALPLLLSGVNGLAQSGPERFSVQPGGRDAMVPKGALPPTFPPPTASPGLAKGLYDFTPKGEIERLNKLVALQEQKIALLELQIKELKEKAGGSK